MNNLTICTSYELTNKELNKVTNNIIKAGNNIGKATLDIALQLKRVDSERLFEDDGFKNACDYAMKVFGMSKTSAYDLINVGMFLDLDTKKCVLPVASTEWSHTQLQALVPLKSVEFAEDLIDGEIINSDMSVRDLKKTIEDYLNGDEELEEETDDSIEGEATETASVDVVSTITIDVLSDMGYIFHHDGEDNHLNTYADLEKALKKYLHS